MGDAAYFENVEAQAGVLPPGESPPKKESRTWVWVVGVIVVLLVGTAIYLYSRRYRPKPPPSGTYSLGTQPLQFTPCQGGQCDQFKVAGSDAGSTACMSMTYYDGVPPPDFGNLGSYVQCVSSVDGCDSPPCPDGYGFQVGPNSVTVSTAQDQGTAAPVHPSSFDASKNYCNTCARTNFSVWSMVCPPGYVSLGDVVLPGCGAPLTSDYWCVPIECALPGTAKDVLWEDSAPSEGCHNPQSVTLYGVLPQDPDRSLDGKFFKAVYESKAPPPTQDLWVLRAGCTVVSPSRPSVVLGNGNYYVLWGTRYLQGASGSGLSLVYNPQQPTIWSLQGGRLSPSAGTYATVGSATSSPATVSIGSSAPQGEWVVSGGAAQGSGAIYNARCNGCLSADLMLVVRDCGPQTAQWNFIPAGSATAVTA